MDHRPTHLGVESAVAPAATPHPGMLVSDLPALAEALAAAGVDVTWDAELPGHERICAADPFGSRLELIEPQGCRRQSSSSVATARSTCAIGLAFLLSG